MNALRLLLIALGCLFAIAAFGALIGFIDSAREDDSLPTAGAWLGAVLLEILLVSIAVGLFYFAKRMVRDRHAREHAAMQSEVPVVLFCPQCDSSELVQGPENVDWLVRKSYTARCVACGYRPKVSREEWQHLPLPEGGEPYETWDDRKHLIRRSPMTAGQTVVVLMGMVGIFVVLFVIDDFDLDLLGVTFLPVVFGCWWLGRVFFRPKHDHE